MTKRNFEVGKYYLTTLDNIGTSKIRMHEEYDNSMPYIFYDIVPKKVEEKINYKLVTLQYIGKSLFRETSSNMIINTPYSFTYKENNISFSDEIVKEERIITNMDFHEEYIKTMNNPLTIINFNNIEPILKPVDDKNIKKYLKNISDKNKEELVSLYSKILKLDELMAYSENDYLDAKKLLKK